jgi:hypothetical protein
MTTLPDWSENAGKKREKYPPNNTNFRGGAYDES